MSYFQRMTTNTKDSSKKNVVIMGRKTWDSIPKKYKPMSNRINFVLSRNDLKLDYPDVYSFNNLNDAIKAVGSDKFSKLVEDVWVIGGSSIYEVKSSYLISWCIAC